MEFFRVGNLHIFLKELLFLLGENVQNAPVYCYTDSLLGNSVGHQVDPGSTELPLCTDFNCAIEKMWTSIFIHWEGTESGLYNLFSLLASYVFGAE